jgi:hypothetical protein
MYRIFWVEGGSDGWDNETDEPRAGVRVRVCGEAGSAESALDLAEHTQQWAALVGWEEGEVVITDEQQHRIRREDLVAHYFRIDRKPVRSSSVSWDLN